MDTLWEEFGVQLQIKRAMRCGSTLERLVVTSVLM